MTSWRTLFLLRFFLFAALKGEGRRRMEWSQRGRALLTTISAPPLKFSKLNTSSQNSTTFLRTFYKRILEPIYWNSYESLHRPCRLPIYFIYMDRSSIWVRYSLYLRRYCYILEQPRNILSQHTTVVVTQIHVNMYWTNKYQVCCYLLACVAKGHAVTSIINVIVWYSVSSVAGWLPNLQGWWLV